MEFLVGWLRVSVFITSKRKEILFLSWLIAFAPSAVRALASIEYCQKIRFHCFPVCLEYAFETSIHLLFNRWFDFNGWKVLLCLHAFSTACTHSWHRLKKLSQSLQTVEHWELKLLVKSAITTNKNSCPSSSVWRRVRKKAMNATGSIIRLITQVCIIASFAHPEDFHWSKRWCFPLNSSDSIFFWTARYEKHRNLDLAQNSLVYHVASDQISTNKNLWNERWKPASILETLTLIGSPCFHYVLRKKRWPTRASGQSFALSPGHGVSWSTSLDDLILQKTTFLFCVSAHSSLRRGAITFTSRSPSSWSQLFAHFLSRIGLE